MSCERKKKSTKCLSNITDSKEIVNSQEGDWDYVFHHHSEEILDYLKHSLFIFGSYKVNFIFGLNFRKVKNNEIVHERGSFIMVHLSSKVKMILF